ncbi:hypothetical protein [Nonomuraea sp. C10]|uniref:hypothetical protein n=1 Tax=Nonomuraea sp. C10 TaxID=2600577 RepID=UPI001650A232|nr:hypothetical protein [Nonomuraea sp. C10]
MLVLGDEAARLPLVGGERPRVAAAGGQLTGQDVGADQRLGGAATRRRRRTVPGVPEQHHPAREPAVHLHLGVRLEEEVLRPPHLLQQAPDQPAFVGEPPGHDALVLPGVIAVVGQRPGGEAQRRPGSGAVAGAEHRGRLARYAVDPAAVFGAAMAGQAEDRRAEAQVPDKALGRPEDQRAGPPNTARQRRPPGRP